MPQATITDIKDLIRCPKCRSGLSFDSVPSCDACGQTYPVIGEQPVLVDFDNSIFGPEFFTVAPQESSKGSRIGRFLDGLTYGTNSATTENAARFMKLAGPVILVVGGGSRGAGTEPLYSSKSLIVGTDVYVSPNTVLVCDGHALPFADHSFDGVFIQAVLEHVLEPAIVVSEIHRVLKPGGIVYAETPFIQQVHEGAFDFTRFTHSGHRWLFRRFDQVEAGMVGGPSVGLLWSISYFLRALGANSRLQALITAMFFWTRHLGWLTRRPQALDAASGLFFLGRRAETELRPGDMVAYYDQR